MIRTGACAPPPIHYVERGTGSSLLLLHGLGGSSRSWSPILDALCAERTVVAMDLPGFGQTPALPGEVSLRRLADTVADFLTSHDLVGTDAVGSSMGAALALELARRKLVEKVIALNPAGFWLNAWERWVFCSSLSISIHSARQLQRFLPDLFASPLWRTLLLWQLSPRPWRLSAQLVIEEVKGYVGAQSFDDLLRDLANSPPQASALNGSTNQIIIGWGRQDRICFPRQAKMALRLFPDAKIHWFEKCGHFSLHRRIKPERLASVRKQASDERKGT
jgi:pimeloyl-ACP methyl ester carboxylesterase